nr:MAG TPA: hypothetical protein [Caudoviricetes sp.]
MAQRGSRDRVFLARESPFHPAPAWKFPPNHNEKSPLKGGAVWTSWH